jgi:hypothetical protein
MLVTKYLDMGVYWEVESKFHAFLSCSLDGSEWPALHQGTYTSKLGGWEHQRAALEVAADRKIMFLSGIETQSFSVYPIALMNQLCQLVVQYDQWCSIIYIGSFLKLNNICNQDYVCIYSRTSL